MMNTLGNAFAMQRRPNQLFMVPLLVAIMSCASATGPAKYPDTKLLAHEISLTVVDPRSGDLYLRTEAPVMNKNEEDTYPQPLPPSFVETAERRLTMLRSEGGTHIEVQTEVRRCDITFYNQEYRGDFVRVDVVLGFEVRTESGALLDKGRTGLWQEIPHEQATEQEMHRLLDATAIGAFDEYFASEAVLGTINENLRRYQNRQSP